MADIKPFGAKERVILNVGGKRFETYISTLIKYPNSLLGTMFHERNAEMLKPDANGEFFFDRSPVAFESVLNFYRTGKLKMVSSDLFDIEEELDYWQIPRESIENEQKLGTRLALMALEVVRKKAEPMLSKIKFYILETIHEAALNGVQSFSIEFRESRDYEFYAYLSNFTNRELLLHDLLEQSLDVSFNDMTSGVGHSYILFITLWNRHTRQLHNDSVNTALLKILHEMRQGVEVQTSKDNHILTVQTYKLPD